MQTSRARWTKHGRNRWSYRPAPSIANAVSTPYLPTRASAWVGGIRTIAESEWSLHAQVRGSKMRRRRRICCGACPRKCVLSAILRPACTRGGALQHGGTQPKKVTPRGDFSKVESAPMACMPRRYSGSAVRSACDQSVSIRRAEIFDVTRLPLSATSPPCYGDSSPGRRGTCSTKVPSPWRPFRVSNKSQNHKHTST